MAQQITMDQTVDSLTNKLIKKEMSSSEDSVKDQVLQCQMEMEYQIEKLKAQAANAKNAPERLSCNLRVKALTILTDRLLGVCGFQTTVPSDLEVAWARKHFGLEQ